MAAEGNYHAAELLGEAYWFGNECKQDFKESIHWYKRAAKGGEKLSISMLGVAYDEGLGVEQSYKIARRYYQRAATRFSFQRLSLHYLFGLGMKVNAKKGFQYVKNVARLGLPSSEFNLGLLYYAGWGTEKSFEESLRYLNLAASKGHRCAVETIKQIKCGKSLYGVVILDKHDVKPFSRDNVAAQTPRILNESTLENKQNVRPIFTVEATAIEIGERIRAARKLKGWTQEDLASAMGHKSRRGVQNIEKAESNMSVETVIAAMNALDIKEL